MVREVQPQNTTREKACHLWLKVPNPMVTFFKNYLLFTKNDFIFAIENLWQAKKKNAELSHSALDRNIQFF